MLRGIESCDSRSHLSTMFKKLVWDYLSFDVQLVLRSAKKLHPPYQNTTTISLNSSYKPGWIHASFYLCQIQILQPISFQSLTCCAFTDFAYLGFSKRSTNTNNHFQQPCHAQSHFFPMLNLNLCRSSWPGLPALVHQVADMLNYNKLKLKFRLPVTRKQQQR